MRRSWSMLLKQHCVAWLQWSDRTVSTISTPTLAFSAAQLIKKSWFLGDREAMVKQRFYGYWRLGSDPCADDGAMSAAKTYIFIAVATHM
eukprot:535114-Amphidinium_carterae.1